MIGPISFAAPWILAGLLALPALYFLLRATPPAPRRQIFPPLRLLRDIAKTARTPERMPLWLLLLRLLAAALLLIGFAGPQIVPPRLLSGTGPILLAIDNGWATAPDFAGLRRAARIIIDQSKKRGIILLAAAGPASGQPPRATGILRRIGALDALGALHAEPWPANRTQDLTALHKLHQRINTPTAIDLSDDLSTPGLHQFITALAPARIITAGADAIRLLEPPNLAPNGALIARLAIVPQPDQVRQPILAETAAGAALARVVITLKPGARQGRARINLPLYLSSKITRLALPGTAAPGAIALLDGATRLVVVGVTAGAPNPDQKLLGSLYYIRRALPPTAKIRTGSITHLIASGVSAIILADRPLSAPTITALRHFMTEGGVVIRFAGPLTAAKPDALTPDPLLRGVRALGGSLSAGKAAPITQFTNSSPLSGLTLPRHTTISRQILANPATLDPGTIWARLADGTPIVLGTSEGRGALVSVLTTANTAWSDWPIAADFPSLITRLVHLGTGAPPKTGLLRPLRVLNGAGQLVVPGSAARKLPAADFTHIPISPSHPPGLWGNVHGSIALNIAGHIPPLRAATLPSGVPVTGLDALPRARRFGPTLLATALALLIADLLISLLLRGAIRWRAAIALLLIVTLPRAHAAANAAAVPPGALHPMLAYVKTGTTSVNRITRAGLTALSDLVNQQTAARLGAPRGVVPGRDNLNLYPLLYWPITSATTKPTRSTCAALDAYMKGGGLLVIDTDGGGSTLAGSGAGFDPGAGTALRHATACLAIPPLEILTDHDTLAHTFFLARHFPGRFAGAPVYIAAKGARDADGVSPVVIGANGWAAAWALDATGAPMRALLPGTPGQRQNADWFGVNLVMYALTGTYKSDQVQIPTILRRLSE